MIYCYKIIRDYGFAPNPFFNVCTLATCKPQIRKSAKIGDWVAGFGGLKTSVPNKLVYLMRVDNIKTFDEYWHDAEFLCKIPRFDKKYSYCYGDNIYHHNEKGEWIQELSHHSYEDRTNYVNLTHDTSVDRLLISYTYWYFGEKAIELPQDLALFIPNCRGYRKHRDDDKGKLLVEWVSTMHEKGIHGLPSSWSLNSQFVRFKGET
ncbi:MAG: hypothetical protein E7262_00615 [Lachnospiraceae bacterium]|nr:hypothetical protein [Lachnospiraceae bacterium]